jgi:hypothetical protein
MQSGEVLRAFLRQAHLAVVVWTKRPSANSAIVSTANNLAAIWYPNAFEKHGRFV